MKSKKLKNFIKISVLSFALSIGVFSVSISQDAGSEGDTVGEVGDMKETVCILDNSTKCRKPGEGCSEEIKCPGLDKWVKTVGDVVKIGVDISKL